MQSLSELISKLKEKRVGCTMCSSDNNLICTIASKASGRSAGRFVVSIYFLSSNNYYIIFGATHRCCMMYIIVDRARGVRYTVIGKYVLSSYSARLQSGHHLNIVYLCVIIITPLITPNPSRLVAARDHIQTSASHDHDHYQSSPPKFHPHHDPTNTSGIF